MSLNPGRSDVPPRPVPNAPQRPFVVTPEEWRGWRSVVFQNYALLVIVAFGAGVAVALVWQWATT